MTHLNPNHVSIKIAASIKEAPRYHDEGVATHKLLNLDQVVIVRNGTVEGRSTIDIVLTDKDGNKFVTMVTGRILKSIASAVGEE